MASPGVPDRTNLFITNIEILENGLFKIFHSVNGNIETFIGGFCCNGEMITSYFGDISRFVTIQFEETTWK